MAAIKLAEHCGGTSLCLYWYNTDAYEDSQDCMHITGSRGCSR